MTRTELFVLANVVGATCTLALAIGVGGCARLAGGNSSDAGATGGNVNGSGGASQPSDSGGASSGTAGATECTCSPDRRAVIACNGGAIIKACADNQACREGLCVDGCAIAESNASAQGCDFYSVVPPPGSWSDGSCFAAMLANTWSAPITITVGYGGQSLDVTAIARTPSTTGKVVTYAPLPGGKLDPGQMAILFLNAAPPPDRMVIDYIDCPTPAGVTTPVTVAGTGTGQAFHIKTSAPVAAYDIYPYGGAKSYVSSATLLIPTSAWGTSYIAADGYGQGIFLAAGSPSVQIVAAQDNTQVTIKPTAPIIGGAGVPATGRGQPHAYSLSAGQMLQFLQPAELAGSVVSASKAVGVWGGSSLMLIPSVGLSGAADAAHQQLVPVNLLGHEYAAVRYRDRIEGLAERVPWTLIGAVDGTTLTYDPAQPGAPTTINRGQSVEFTTGDPFTVKSADDQHPFYLAGHMTGCLSVDAHMGDPETVNTVPPQQWLNSYLFLTDPTYSDTNLVFVRKKVKSSFSDVTLDCVGTLGNWKPIGTAGDYEFTRVDLVTASVPEGACNNGVHTAKSDAPFGLTVWGWDQAVSYAYPAGMGVKPINDVVVIQ